MLLRSLITLALCALAPGCSGMSADGLPASETDAASPQLELRSDPSPALLLGETQELRVRYLSAAGRPVVGAPLSFDLWNGASGASLAPAEAITDQDGEALATLRAGSIPSEFQVRVSVEELRPVYFNVTVGPPVAPSALVSVSYQGNRGIVSRSVTLVPAMNCDRLTQVVEEEVRTETSYVLFQAGDRAPFKLGADLTYAIVAWGSDDTNSKLAHGCVDIKAPLTADEAKAVLEVDVLLKDTELGLAPGSFELSFALDVSLPMMALKASAEQAVFARLPKKPLAAASFYLDQLENSLAPFPALRASLEQELDSLLNVANGGPLTFAAQLAQLTIVQGGKATLRAQLNIPEQDRIGTLDVSRIDAVAVDLARELPLLGPLAATSQLEARYDEALAAIVVDSLSIQLGLGSYANWLLDQSGAPIDLVKQLAPSHGCAQVSLLVGKHPTLPFTASQAEAACEQAAASLVGTVRGAWPALDSERSTLWFQGNIPVHDRDLDRRLAPREERKVVDDVGPATLAASWSSSFSAAASDTVSATLRVPPSTALAL